MRLTRSEANMAYRMAEQARWRQFDFVVGYEIKLSQTHPCHDICDTLAGKYPKSFVWTGWHPMDKCYCVSILKSDDGFWRDLGEDNPGKSGKEVTDVPQGFKDWVRDNRERIENAEKRGTQPYFIRDNQKRIDGILKQSARIEANRKEYERLKADPNYKDVEFNPENGGLKATHVRHNFDRICGHWEKEVQNIGYGYGRSVILGNEFGNIIGERFTEGTWDGLQFELATRESATENNILRGLKHCADKRITEVAILYFPNGGYDIKKLQSALRRYKGYSQFPERTYIDFKKIICIESDVIVYEEPF